MFQDQHAALPTATHDEFAREEFCASLRRMFTTELFPGGADVYYKSQLPAFEAKHGRRAEIAPGGEEGDGRELLFPRRQRSRPRGAGAGLGHGGRKHRAPARRSERPRQTQARRSGHPASEPRYEDAQVYRGGGHPRHARQFPDRDRRRRRLRRRAVRSGGACLRLRRPRRNRTRVSAWRRRP